MAKSEGGGAYLFFEYEAKDLKKKEKKRKQTEDGFHVISARVYLPGPGEATDVPSF